MNSSKKIKNKNKFSSKNKDHERIEKIKNGMSYSKNGWKYISIYGDPEERGYAY